MLESESRLAARTCTKHSFSLDMPSHSTSPNIRHLQQPAGAMATLRALPLIRAIPPTSTFSRIPKIPRFAPLPLLTERIQSFHITPAPLSNGSSTSNKNKSAEKTKPALGGSYARTNGAITVEFPESGEMPSSRLVSGTDRAGASVFPTLATFSLQGKVGVVTGGARGLGLVMGQGM
jgi:D-arabinitol 2-dehydrogenase